MAFKPNTDDIREAVSVELISQLVRRGVSVQAFDPQANGSASVALPPSVIFSGSPIDACTRAHAVVVLTEWPTIIDANWNRIVSTMRHPKYVFDGRNCLEPGYMRGLGFQYVGVGRGRQRSQRVSERRDWQANPVNPVRVKKYSYTPFDSLRLRSRNSTPNQMIGQRQQSSMSRAHHWLGLQSTCK